MTPPLNTPSTGQALERYPTPDEPPRDKQRVTVPKSSAAKKSRPQQQELRFFNINDPKELRNKDQLRLNRQHVMRTFLDKEKLKPSGQRDARVDGSGTAAKRKRSKASLQAGPSSTLELLPASRQTDLPTPESSCPSDRVYRKAGCRPRVEAEDEHKTSRQNQDSPRSRERQLVRGSNGAFKNSPYLRADLDKIPFVKCAAPNTTLGSALNPFDTWPTFSDESIDVNQLKWSCSRRFGSEAIALYWVPELLRARHAFLSTICISASHDDIMSRAVRPAPFLTTRESIERMRVRSEVMAMINESMQDPEMQAADATMIAVLHLLNSEIMGCDDRVMKTHQNGLHTMVRQRGGMDKLGVNGQLASILTM